jgi:four helix bundle protein
MLNSKLETLNPKQTQSIETSNTKKYDLGERTEKFAKRIITFLDKLPKQMIYLEISKQLLRSSCSVGANYVEAEESLSKKDFFMRIKISRKEAKESRYWLNLLNLSDKSLHEEKNSLIQESVELMRIFGSIVKNAS